MSRYTVKEVAKLSGVSVRALHHYDEIGLLKPAAVGSNGYRYYGREELLRLQQILFHRELRFPLEAIRAVLDDPKFDRAAALKAHRKALDGEARRLKQLVRTIDDTLAALEGDKEMDDTAMYLGFSPEKQAEYEAWLVDRYGGDMRTHIDDAKAKMKDWGKGDFAVLQAEAGEIEQAMAKALATGLPADSAGVRALMGRHHAWVGRSWKKPPTRDAFIGLGDLYLENPDFKARYDAIAPGLAEYYAAAMRAFAEASL
ncbi:MAG: transcriptional regulator, MerR family [Caulobacter sp.]|nr:transcriptional regulator, MerR family [Caulobacter sp.]